MTTDIIHFGPFRYDLDRGSLHQGHQIIPLRPRARAVLEYLLRHQGRVVSREELIHAVWRGGHVTPAALRGCLRDIRLALNDAAHAPRYLETVGRAGFRFRPMAEDPMQRPVVGRARELETLHRHLAQARGGERRLVFVAGEAGAGKTTLIQHFLETLDRQAVQILQGHCLEDYNPGEPFQPILEILVQLCRRGPRQRGLHLLRRRAPGWLAQLPEVQEASAPDSSASGGAARLWREFAVLMETLATDTSLILIVEDLHWGDSASLALLGFLAQRPTPSPMLIIGSFRPEALALEDDPLSRLHHTLGRQGLRHSLSLSALSHEALGDYARARLESLVDPALVQFILTRSGGNALFATDLLEFLLNSRQLLDGPRGWALADTTMDDSATGLRIPLRSAQVIAHQLSHLTDPQRQLLEVASVVGSSFAMAAVAAGLDLALDQAERLAEGLARRLQLMEEVDLAHWPDGTLSTLYRFHHHCHRVAIYRQLALGRRVSLHRRIARRLMQAFGADTERIGVQLAYHFQHGEDWPRALHYHRLSADTARARHAPREAALHYRQALAILDHLDEAQPTTRLALLLRWIESLAQHQGDAAMVLLGPLQCAHTLAQRVGTTEQRLRVLWGLHSFYVLRGEAAPERPYLRELVTLANHTDQAIIQAVTTHAVAGHWFLGHGRPARAARAYERALVLYAGQPRLSIDRPAHALPWIMCQANAAWAQACVGRLDSALDHAERALALSRHLDYPFGEALALIYLAKIRTIRGEYRLLPPLTEQIHTLCRDHGFQLLLTGALCYQGWCEVRQGKHQAVSLIRDSFLELQARGASALTRLVAALLVDTLLYLHQPDEATRVMTLMESRWDGCHAAELLRLQALLLVYTGRPSWHTQADGLLREALRLARRHRAGLFQLRAAMALARLWRGTARAPEAHAQLSASLGAMPEARDTPILQEARRLLDIHQNGVAPWPC